MSVKGMFCLMAVIFIALAFVVSCSDTEEAKFVEYSQIMQESAEDLQVRQKSGVDENAVVVLELHVEGCVCSRHSKFNITWDEEFSSLINSSALINALIEADTSGAFLCDCEGDGEEYFNVVKSIKPLSDGIKVILKQEVWLDRSDVVPAMRKLLEERIEEVFYGHRFYIY